MEQNKENEKNVGTNNQPNKPASSNPTSSSFKSANNTNVNKSGLNNQPNKLASSNPATNNFKFVNNTAKNTNNENKSAVNNQPNKPASSNSTSSSFNFKPINNNPTNSDSSSTFVPKFGDNINKNVGHFGDTGDTIVKQDFNPNQNLKLDVDEKVVDKAAKEKIDFDRFSKTKKEFKHVETKPRTKFGEKISMMLRSKKGLTVTWAAEMALMFIIIGLSIFFVVWIHKYLDRNFIKSTCYGVTKAGYVFFWIGIFPCLIPLIYLMTTWFIGINQVASSKMYHIFFWITAGVSLFCFIMGLSLCGNAMHYISINPDMNSFINILNTIL